MAGTDDALVLHLAGLHDVVRNLLDRHVPDEHGRCRACTVPGTGIPFAPWPCALHFYAAAAAGTSADG